MGEQQTSAHRGGPRQPVAAPGELRRSGALPRREPGASGYERFLAGDLGDELVVRSMVASVPVSDPADPQLWARIEQALPKYAAGSDSSGNS